MFKLPKFTSFGQFVREIFQDVDSSYSAKRTGFFIFISLIVACVVGSVFWKIGVPAMIWNGLVDLVKWIGAAILGERAPAALSALRGMPVRIEGDK